MKLVGKNGKEITVEAKIDTGADSTSIDTELAKQLGFEETLLHFSSRLGERDVLKEFTKEERGKLFANIPDLAETIPIRSSHGTSYRPMIRIDLIMDDFTIPAKVSVIDRSHLDYQVIIGRKNLGKFLIDTNK